MDTPNTPNIPETQKKATVRIGLPPKPTAKQTVRISLPAPRQEGVVNQGVPATVNQGVPTSQRAPIETPQGNALANKLPLQQAGATTPKALPTNTLTKPPAPQGGATNLKPLPNSIPRPPTTSQGNVLSKPPIAVPPANVIPRPPTTSYTPNRNPILKDVFPLPPDGLEESNETVKTAVAVKRMTVYEGTTLVDLALIVISMTVGIILICVLMNLSASLPKP